MSLKTCLKWCHDIHSGLHPLTFLLQHIGHQDQYITTSNISRCNPLFIYILLSLRNVCRILRWITLRSSNLCFLKSNTIFLLCFQSFKFLLVNLIQLIIIDSRLKDIFLEIKIYNLFLFGIYHNYLVKCKIIKWCMNEYVFIKPLQQST